MKEAHEILMDDAMLSKTTTKLRPGEVRLSFPELHRAAVLSALEYAANLIGEQEVSEQRFAYLPVLKSLQYRLREATPLSTSEELAHLEDALNWLQNDVFAWSSRNFGDVDAVPPWQPLSGLSEELGELEEHADVSGMPRLIGALAHAHLKHTQKIRGSQVEAIVDGTGDVAVFLADFAARFGLRLGGAVVQTWAKVRQRDWKKFPHDGMTS